MRPTGAQLAALLAHCPTFHAGDGECCATGRLDPDLCDYHQGWIEGWEQAKEAMR